MDRDIEMEENHCRIAQRLEFPLSDEEDLHEASSTIDRTSSNISSDRLDSSGSDEGLGMTIRITSPRKPRFLRTRARESMSPPYSGVRALRLFDSPATPKTLLENSSAMITPVLATPAPRNRMRTLFNMSSAKSTDKKDNLDTPPAANVNPFTPTGMLLTSKKRTRSKRSLNGSLVNSFDEEVHEATDESDEELPPKRIALHQTSVPRYHKEFHEICLIGKGEFGSVHKCLNRLDGCTYAVKKSLMPVAGSPNERSALNEVWAHAVLGQHPHVVRYYSAWAENGHMIIQNEFCNSGTLEELIRTNQQNNVIVNEPQLKSTLLQIAEGLHYIHSKQLAHMDIKPGNIFICRENIDDCSVHHDSDDGFDELDDDYGSVTYKIGDLGHVTSVVQPIVEEGDCRYLPVEILQENYDNLAKADIFSLGLTIYEMAGGGQLPKNGDEWHAIRQGRLPYNGRYSIELHNLLELMIHPDPTLRPSTQVLTQHPVLGPNGAKSKDQLSRELNAERLKNRQLSEKLQEAARHIQNLMPLSRFSLEEVPAPKMPKLQMNEPCAARRLLLGRKMNRSLSNADF
ncbi:wee1-like protein kinase [Daphnia pulicaria]|uniref:wee1-like protein kinase n=1 Tax=Daphnia pulicaria TaxID=35523 RepID=UPI001EEC9B06|nr:wee1-like protein kinase [Daphnia pulicaria]